MSARSVFVYFAVTTGAFAGPDGAQEGPLGFAFVAAAGVGCDPLRTQHHTGCTLASVRDPDGAELQLQ